MKKVAVVGVGETKFSGPQTKTEVELFAEAATEAINESNLKPADIKALFIGNALGDFDEGQGMAAAYCAENIGCLYVPANRYEGACASASMAIRDAYMWVASGYYDIVIAGGIERAATMGTGLATRTFAMFSDARYEYPAGVTFPAVFAMLTHLYADTYKIPLQKLREQMARVTQQSYKHGAINPKAQFFGKNADITIDKILNSFVVALPSPSTIAVRSRTARRRSSWRRSGWRKSSRKNRSISPAWPGFLRPAYQPERIFTADTCARVILPAGL